MTGRFQRARRACAEAITRRRRHRLTPPHAATVTFCVIVAAFLHARPCSPSSSLSTGRFHSVQDELIVGCALVLTPSHTRHSPRRSIVDAVLSSAHLFRRRHRRCYCERFGTGVSPTNEKKATTALTRPPQYREKAEGSMVRSALLARCFCGTIGQWRVCAFTDRRWPVRSIVFGHATKATRWPASTLYRCTHTPAHPSLSPPVSLSPPLSQLTECRARPTPELTERHACSADTMRRCGCPARTKRS